MPQARSVSAFNDGREPPGQPLDPSAHSNGLLTVTHLCALPWEFGVPSLGVPTLSDGTSLPPYPILHGLVSEPRAHLSWSLWPSSGAWAQGGDTALGMSQPDPLCEHLREVGGGSGGTESCVPTGCACPPFTHL